MIGYTLRVSALLLGHALLGAKADTSKPFRYRTRAWPWHCDVYRHLNNAVYMRLAEDARWAWTARTPLFREALSKRWVFLVGGADIVYRRPVPALSSFEIVCRVVGADDRWLYFSQEFILPSGKSACRILIRAMVRGKSGGVSPSEVLSATGIALPEPSEELDWMKRLADSQLKEMGES